MPKLVWVLLWTLNGHPMQSEPMIGEACVLHMLSKSPLQNPRCVHIDGKQVMVPPRD